MTDLSIAKQFDPARVADTREQPGDEALHDFRARSQFADVLSIRSAIQARAQRGRHFNPALFADPAWDMLLELYAAALTQRKLTVSRLAERSCVPMTNAVPPGICDFRKSAVASAEVQIDSSGTMSPDARSRADRSRGVKIELFVSTRNGTP